MYSPRKTNTKLDASLKLGEEAERKDKGRGSVTNGWLGVRDKRVAGEMSQHNHPLPCDATWQETSGPEQGFKQRRVGNGGRGAAPQLQALAKGDPASHQHEGP